MDAAEIKFLLRRLALQDRDVARYRFPGHVRPVIGDDTIPERAIDDLVCPGFEARRDGADGKLAKRYEIGKAPHKAHKLSIRRHLQKVAREQRSFVFGPLRPVHDRAAFKMTPDANERQPRQHLPRLLGHDLGGVIVEAGSALRSMERSRLIRRLRGDDDRRKVRVFLTAKAMKLRDELLTLARGITEEAELGIAARYLACFRRVITRMTANLDQIEN